MVDYGYLDSYQEDEKKTSSLYDNEAECFEYFLIGFMMFMAG